MPSSAQLKHGYKIGQNLWAEKVGSVDEIQIKACSSGLPTS